MSNSTHHGFTRTNLKTARPSLGRDTAKRTPFNANFNPLPSQELEQGAVPLLYAAADPGAVNGGYYGPSRWFGLREAHHHGSARRAAPRTPPSPPGCGARLST